MSLRVFRPISTTIIIALALLAATLTAASRPAVAAAEISLSGPATGGTFQGIGALSAGATSRLLVDYPEPERDQILDYLFKPGYGASLQVLKVEIGGDTDSTAGSEPSHARTSGDLDCDRGYEWWLMREARQRNPHIVLWGLQWGAPSWVGGSVYTDGNLDFLTSWLGCAAEHHLSIDMMGGWNERSASASVRAPWYERFRQRLDAAGLRHTKLLIGDEDGNGRWTSAENLAADPALRASVAALGGHYPCRGNPRGTTCASGDNLGSAGNPSLAQSLGLPLWASEMGSDNYVTGAPNLARAYNRQYVDGRLTGSINWSLAACWYQDITQYAGDGLLDCETPWTGDYKVDRSLWATAHTTQFTAPGWRYDDTASGYGALAGGSYVTLKSPDGGRFSTVVETTQATAPQQLTLTGTPSAQVRVWDTDLGSADPDAWFAERAPLDAVDGAVTATLRPGHIYTFTNTTGQHKGDAAPRTGEPWRLPYRENFDGYPYGTSPKYFSDQEGTWETAPCRVRGGKCLEQTVTAKPVRWRPETLYPLTVAGDPSWSGDYTVSVDALLDRPGTDAALAGRVSGFDLLGTGLAGYHLRLGSSGTWTLFKETTGSRGGDHVDTTLATGTADMSGSPWHSLRLVFRGDTITPVVDGVSAAAVTDGTYTGGQVGLQLGGYADTQFDDLTVSRPG